MNLTRPCVRFPSLGLYRQAGALQPIVDADKYPVLRPGCLSLRYQRPPSGLRSQTSSQLIGAVISLILNRRKLDEIEG